MWHVTCDTWQVTHDMWGEVNLLSKFQLSSFYGLGVKVFWIYFNKWWRSQSVNKLINEKGVCRTAPATPGLLKRQQVCRKETPGMQTKDTRAAENRHQGCIKQTQGLIKSDTRAVDYRHQCFRLHTPDSRAADSIYQSYGGRIQGMQTHNTRAADIRHQGWRHYTQWPIRQDTDM